MKQTWQRMAILPYIYIFSLRQLAGEYMLKLAWQCIYLMGAFKSESDMAGIIITWHMNMAYILWRA